MAGGVDARTRHVYDTDLWLASLELDWAHRDPADRLIVALAARHKLPLLTRDTAIRAWYPHVVA